jgi:THO complex subunit 2
MSPESYWLVAQNIRSSVPRQLTVLQATGTVNATVCRERLETALVANVGLIADKATFEKKEIRTRTGLL